MRKNSRRETGPGQFTEAWFIEFSSSGRLLARAGQAGGEAVALSIIGHQGGETQHAVFGQVSDFIMNTGYRKKGGMARSC
jgi:hypothetical protein